MRSRWLLEWEAAEGSTRVLFDAALVVIAARPTATRPFACRNTCTTQGWRLSHGLRSNPHTCKQIQAATAVPAAEIEKEQEQSMQKHGKWWGGRGSLEHASITLLLRTRSDRCLELIVGGHIHDVLVPERGRLGWVGGCGKMAQRV